MERKKYRGNTRYWNLQNNYPIHTLIEHNITEIKKMNRLEKDKNIKPLIQKIIEWGTTSPEEAIGTLEIVKEHFIRMADEE